MAIGALYQQGRAGFDKDAADHRFDIMAAIAALDNRRGNAVAIEIGRRIPAAQIGVLFLHGQQIDRRCQPQQRHGRAQRQRRFLRTVPGHQHRAANIDAAAGRGHRQHRRRRGHRHIAGDRQFQAGGGGKWPAVHHDDIGQPGENGKRINQIAIARHPFPTHAFGGQPRLDGGAFTRSFGFDRLDQRRDGQRAHAAVAHRIGSEWRHLHGDNLAGTGAGKIECRLQPGLLAFIGFDRHEDRLHRGSPIRHYTPDVNRGPPFRKPFQSRLRSAITSPTSASAAPATASADQR